MSGRKLSSHDVRPFVAARLFSSAKRVPCAAAPKGPTAPDVWAGQLYLSERSARWQRREPRGNGRASGQTTQGISLDVQSAQKMPILKCTSHALESQTTFGCEIVHSRSASSQPASNSKGCGGVCFDECNSSRHEHWSPKIDRHDNQEHPLWLPCRAAVNGGHPLEIVLLDFLAHQECGTPSR